MTRQQMQWAKQHDWFIKSEKHLNNGHITYSVFAHDGCKRHTPKKEFSNIDDLREWAGY